MSRGSRICWSACAACLAGLLVAAPSVYALINPNFTPRHLIDSSGTIIELSLKASDKPKTLVGEVVRAFKDKDKDKDKVGKGEVVIGFEDLPEDDARELAESLKAKPGQHVLLFCGQYGASGEANLTAALHQGGRWLTLDGSGRSYKAVAVNGNLEQTWAGGTDMFIRAVEMGLEDADMDFPCESGVRWQEGEKKVGKIEGPVFSTRHVMLGGKPGGMLHIGAERGDRLYQYDPAAKGLKDVTAQCKLAAKSAASAWGDFNHDGRLDLASWDGKALSLHLQAADGTFAAKAVETGEALKSGCVGLAGVDCGRKGVPALVASTPERPVLLLPKEDGTYEAAALPDGSARPKDLGVGAPALVADFDGDAVPDVLQIFAKASLLYKGKGAGAFAEPAVVKIGRGTGQGTPFVGDFDHDGRLDVFTAGDDRSRLWQNCGGLLFEEWLKKSGEVAYKCSGGSIGGSTCDLNNDGRQDLVVFYKDTGPMVFFNRGFRSFGDAVGVAPTVQSMDVDSAAQQAGCMADLDGDGAQDLAMVLQGGELMVFLRDVGDAAPLALSAHLPGDAPCAGPLTVVGWRGKHCLGAWNVAAGSSEAFVGVPGANTIRLCWQLPGGKPQEKSVTLEGKGQRLAVGQ